MYAVIETGGKQYMVSEGDVVRVEKLDTEEGKKITFDNILMIGGSDSPKIGTPLVSGAKVAGEVLAQGRAKKIKVFKKIRRKGYRRTRGHRQCFTEVKITQVSEGK